MESDPVFYPLIGALRRLQTSGRFSMRFEKHGDEVIARVAFAPITDPQVGRDIEFVKQTLNIDPTKSEVSITYGALQNKPDQLAVLSRSMIQVMTLLGSDMDVPAEHASQGKTGPNRQVGPNPAALDLPLIRIHSGETRPSNAFTAVRCARTGFWYWISADDFDSKRKFSTILLLFSLAETGVAAAAPMLTIPVQ